MYTYKLGSEEKVHVIRVVLASKLHLMVLCYRELVSSIDQHLPVR